MAFETNRHLDDEDIERYSRGDVAEVEASRFEEHLLICEACQNRVTETDTYLLSMQSASARLRQEDQAKQGPKWFVFKLLIPAVAALAVILLVAVLGFQGSGGPREWLHDRGSAKPAFALSLVATRGNGPAAQAPSGIPLRVELDLAGVSQEPALRLEVVNQLGRTFWQGSVVPDSSKAVASLPALSGGHYFLRAYAPSGRLLREYGLEVAR